MRRFDIGWASRGELATKVWAIVRSYIDPYVRKEAAQKIIEAFECTDCDTMDKCSQLQTDAIAEYYEIEDDWSYDEDNMLYNDFNYEEEEDE